MKGNIFNLGKKLLYLQIKNEKPEYKDQLLLLK